MALLRSAAAGLLGSRVRIVLRTWMFVCCVCFLHRLWPLRLADHSFRVVVPCVCVSDGVWSRNPNTEATVARLRQLHHKKKVLLVSEWMGHRRKRALRNLIFYLGICLLGAKATKSLSEPRFQTGISRTRSRSFNHPTATFDGEGSNSCSCRESNHTL